VAPTRVNIVKLGAKTVVVKGKKGSTKAVVKAYIYLKKGDKIEIV
jgi:ribosomal protein L23